MKAIISVIGKDRVGIMYRISKVLHDCSVNIEDVTQTIMQDYFTMLMLVQIDETKTTFRQLSDALQETGDDIGVSVQIQKEDIFDAMHKI